MDKKLSEFDKGPFYASIVQERQEVYVWSDDFKHDVGMRVGGDFPDIKDRLNYAIAVANTLNNYADLERRLAFLEKVKELPLDCGNDLSDMRELWLDAVEQLEAYKSLRDYGDGFEVIKQLRAQLADLQRLCERAHLILSETWDEHTDEEGYGPISLLRDLEKAKDGKEVKDQSLYIEALQKQLAEKDAEIERLKEDLRLIALGMDESDYGDRDAALRRLSSIAIESLGAA